MMLYGISLMRTEKLNTFVERGLITSEQAEKMDLFTRGDMAKIIYEAKQRNMF